MAGSFVVSGETFNRVVDQINNRFEFFTEKVDELEAKIEKLESEKAPEKKGPGRPKKAA